MGYRLGVLGTEIGGRVFIQVVIWLAIVIQLMKNQEFEVSLLIRQNTEMALKLQAYRKENQELSQKNENLSCWVENLSEVFASISAAWKVITDNEEALYTLMRKKPDAASKQLVGKYISHFKAFDQIVSNLGDKITNEGHSSSATLDAKNRLSSFVSNYNLFFMEFVETFFRFNEECITMTQDKLKEPNLPAQMRQIANQSLENRQKIKEFQDFMAKISQNFQLYETYNHHQLLEGIITRQNKEIQDLKEKTLKQARHIAYMTDYNTDNVNFILQKEQNFGCFCGGAPLQYFSRVWEQNLKNQNSGLSKKQSSHQMVDEEDESIKEKMKQLGELEVEKQVLMQRNVHILAKCEKIKLQNKITDDLILQSPLYQHLRSQFKDLIDYTNDLTLKLNKASDYLTQIEKNRFDQIEELKKKYEKQSSGSRHRSEHQNISVDHTFLNKFKEKVQSYCLDIRNHFNSIQQGIKSKEDSLLSTKESLKILKKQNEDLNRRLGDLQQKQLKNVEHLQFRHQKYNQLEKVIDQLFKSGGPSEEKEKNRKVWDEMVEYAKTRDKKIKAMEDMIKKKQKQLLQKQKVEEVMKTALAETEDIYVKSKEKLKTFEEFMDKMKKEILNLTEENYKIKMESDQEKNILSIRLKNQLEVKSKLQEKVKNCQKVQEEVKQAKNETGELQKKFQEFQNRENEKSQALRVDLKEKERNIKQLNELIAEKEKTIEKLIEEKEKKNLEITKLNLKMNSKTEYEVLKMEMEEYKSKIMCRCGAEREREVVLKTCPHIFCKKCIDDTTANRNRKCPICGTRFTKTDIHEIVWT